MRVPCAGWCLRAHVWVSVSVTVCTRLHGCIRVYERLCVCAYVYSCVYLHVSFHLGFLTPFYICLCIQVGSLMHTSVYCASCVPGFPLVAWSNSPNPLNTLSKVGTITFWFSDQETEAQRG